MFFRKNIGKRNGERVHSESTGEDLVPSLVDEILDSIKQKGCDDGQLGIIIYDNRKGNLAAVRLKMIKAKLQATAKYKYLKKQIDELESILPGVIEKIKDLLEKVHEQKKNVHLALGIIYTLAGFFYILGEIGFSYELLVRMWGLGKAHFLHKWSLVLSLGMAPVIMKLIYSRMVESKYDEKAKVQPRIVTWLFLAITPIVIFSFVYLGHVRGVVFDASNIFSGQDIYQHLLEDQPHLNSISFISMALVFLIGGAILLTVGLKELSRYHLYRQDYKELKKCLKVHCEIKSKLEQFYNDYFKVEAKRQELDDPKRFTELVEIQAELYGGVYTSNHKRSLKQMLVDPECGQSLNGKFHLFSQKAMDHKAVNEVIDYAFMQGGQNGQL